MILAIGTLRSRRGLDAGDGDDAELAGRAAAGDRDAFTELHGRYLDRVFGLLTRLIGPVADRDDLVQESFVRLYLALPGFRAESSIWTFLYQITARVAYEHLRRSTRRRSVSLELEDLDALAGASEEQRLRHRQRLALLFEVLAELKPGRRIAFALIYLEEMSLDEAAAILGISAQAVKQRALKGRRDLEAELRRRERTGGRR